MNFDLMIAQAQAELRSFYKPYFNTEAEMEAFLFDAFDDKSGSPAKRQMLYQVQRFVSLANDIDKLRPGRDCLRILLIKICLESLCSLSGCATGKQRASFCGEFADCFSIEAAKYILDHFRLLHFNEQDSVQ